MCYVTDPSKKPADYDSKTGKKVVESMGISSNDVVITTNKKGTTVMKDKQVWQKKTSTTAPVEEVNCSLEKAITQAGGGKRQPTEKQAVVATDYPESSRKAALSQHGTTEQQKNNVVVMGEENVNSELPLDGLDESYVGNVEVECATGEILILSSLNLVPVLLNSNQVKCVRPMQIRAQSHADVGSPGSGGHTTPITVQRSEQEHAHAVTPNSNKDIPSAEEGSNNRDTRQVLGEDNDKSPITKLGEPRLIQTEEGFVRVNGKRHLCPRVPKDRIHEDISKRQEAQSSDTSRNSGLQMLNGNQTCAIGNSDTEVQLNQGINSLGTSMQPSELTSAAGNLSITVVTRSRKGFRMKSERNFRTRVNRAKSLFDTLTCYSYGDDVYGDYDDFYGDDF